jgi:hypothetical protein
MKLPIRTLLIQVNLLASARFAIAFAAIVSQEGLQAGNAISPSNPPMAAEYSVSTLARGLDFPTAAAFFNNRLWVSEAGHPELAMPAKIKEIRADGSAATILSATMLPRGEFAGPVTDIAFRRGQLWVAHRRISNGLLVGTTSRFDPDHPVETFTTVVVGSAPDRIDRRLLEARYLVSRRVGRELLSASGLSQPIDVGFSGRIALIVDYGVYEPKLRMLAPGTGRVLLFQPTITAPPGTGSDLGSPTEPMRTLMSVSGGSEFGTPSPRPFSRPGTITGAPSPSQRPEPVTNLTPGVDNSRFVFGTSLPPGPFTRPGTIRGIHPLNQNPTPVTDVRRTPDAASPKQEQPAWVDRHALAGQ